MAAFRLLNQFPVFWDQQGRLADGGELRFYESDTTTPKDVYGDQALTVNNGSIVAIGSDGRTVVDVWGDGEYRVRLYDADGTMIGEADNVEVAGGTGQSIPALVTGQFLTNNGALLLWAPIREMPDPTGQDGKYPVASGSGYVLQSPPAPPEIPEPEIVIGDGTFQAGTSGVTTKFYIQHVTDTAPATNALSSSKAVTFPTAFATLDNVLVTVTTSGVSSVTPPGLPSYSVTGWTPGSPSTGVTVNFRQMTDAGLGAEDKINSPVPFRITAIGTIEVVA